MHGFLKTHLPNALTLARLVAVAPLLALLYSPLDNRFLWTLLGLAIILPTDALDGFLARRWGQTSAFGQFLDPLCDKTLMYALLFALFAFDVYVPFVIFPMFLRDSLVDGFRNYMARQGRVASANLFGKAKFTLQTVALFAGLFYLHTGAGADSGYRLLANLALGAAFIASLPGLRVLYTARM